MTRASLRALALSGLLAWGLAGCASLPFFGAAAGSARPAAEAAAPAQAPAGAPGAVDTASRPGTVAGAEPPVVEIVAPGPLQALLDTHLDLARLGRLASDTAVDEGEWARLTDVAPAQVRELLQTEGYFSPDVAVRREAGAPPKLVVQVEPGPRTRVGRLTLDVEGDLARDAAAGDARAQATVADLRRAWAMPQGSVFRNADWSSAKSALLSRLRAAGYATAAYSGTASDVDPQAALARLFLVVDSGPLFRAGELRILGLVTHDPQTVGHLAGFARGAPVTEALLLDYQERLQKSGLFDTVSVTLEPDPARAADAEVRIALRETALQVYTLGVGVSANVGPRVSLEHTHRRVFGRAATARNKVEWGGLRQAWDGELSTHPGEGMVRWLVGGAIERLESSTDVVLSQRLRLGRAIEPQRFERLLFAEVERGSRRVIDGLRTQTVAVSGNWHGVWRELDSVLLPTEGYTLALQGGAGRAFGTNAPDGYFSRAYGRYTLYRPLASGWFAQGRLELGKVFKPAGVPVTDSQLFRAGGDDSVRGYGYRTLGPVVDGVVGSGAVLATGSLELARPLRADLPSVWGAVFIDAGRAAESLSALEPAIGVGVGVRWRSPVGPLRVDLAWGQEVRRLRLHFSVGIAF